MNSKFEQAALFGKTTDVIVAVNRPKAALSKQQREFNRLSTQTRQYRERLVAWEAYQARYAERLATELAPVEKTLREAQRRLVIRIDALLSSGKAEDRLSRRHRATLRDLLADVIRNVLEEGPDPELETLHDKYSVVSSDELRKLDLATAEAMMGSMFGERALDGHQAGSIEELMAHVQEQVASQAEAEQQARATRAAERAAKRGRPSKAERDAERRAAAAKEATASVREIYRKLASALHPDREPDAVERERKTRMMQRANQAYEQGDVLALLALQIELEQIDADHLASLPETRIKHYNDVLQEQLQALREQCRQISMQLELELFAEFRIDDPKTADAALSARVKQAKAVCRGLEADIAHLDDPKRRRAFLERIVLEQADDDAFEPDLELFDMLLQMDPAQSKRRR